MTAKRTFLDAFVDCVRHQPDEEWHMIDNRVREDLRGVSRYDLYRLWNGHIDGGNCHVGLISVKEQVFL